VLRATCYTVHVTGHVEKASKCKDCAGGSEEGLSRFPWTDNPRTRVIRRVLSDLPPARPPRRFRQWLHRLGMEGQIAHLLNSLALTYRTEKDLRGLHGVLPLARGLPVPPGARARGNWRGVEGRLRRRHQWLLIQEGQQAIIECKLFERYGFVALWCSHRRHYYVSDDPRRLDCPDHQQAGWKARYRERHREAARNETMRRSIRRRSRGDQDAFRVASGSLRPEAQEVFRKAEWATNRWVHRRYPDPESALKAYRSWRRLAVYDLIRRQTQPGGLESWRKRWLQEWRQKQLEMTR
jgi:hypothetical protein